MAGTARVSISFDMSAARAEWESDARGPAGSSARNEAVPVVSDLGFEGVVDLARASVVTSCRPAQASDDGELLELYFDQHPRLRPPGRTVRGTSASWTRPRGRGRVDADRPARPARGAGRRRVRSRCCGADEVRGEAVDALPRRRPAPATTQTPSRCGSTPKAGRSGSGPRRPPTAPTSVVSRDDTGGLVSVISLAGMQTVPSTTEFWDFGVAFDIAAPADAMPGPREQVGRGVLVRRGATTERGQSASQSTASARIGGPRMSVRAGRPPADHGCRQRDP